MATHENARRRTSQPATSPRRASRGKRRCAAGQPPTSLQVVASTFALVTTGPGALGIDGTQLGHGLPRRSIGLDELRAIIFHPATSRSCREAIWRHLIVTARSGGPAWLIGAAGIALPELVALADGLTESLQIEAADAHAAVLAGFIDGLKHLDLNQPGMAAGLRWTAYRAALKSVRRPIPRLLPMPSTPPCRITSADTVLSDAVASGVLSPVQAELIGGIRIDNRPLGQVAARLGLSREAARSALHRGEAALAAAVSAGDARRHRCSTENFGGPAVAGPQRRPGCVRGPSTCSDGTSDTGTSANEEGVFCGPAHHPTPAADPPNHGRTERPRRTRVRCARTRNGGNARRRGGESS